MQLFRSFFLMVYILLSAAFSAQSQQLDPGSSDFDPDKQFSITPYGAILGDPVELKVLGKDKVAYSIVTVTPTGEGVRVMLSFVEPQQNGEPGSGHSLMMSLIEVEELLKLLNESQNVDVEALQAYGERHRLVGRVTEPDAQMGEIAVLYEGSDFGRKNLRIVHILGGTPQLFEFTQTGITKLIKQIGHFVDKAENNIEATKL